MTPSKGRFSMDASSSRIWAGVGTSQPYSMSFLPRGAGGAAPANSETGMGAHKNRAMIKRYVALKAARWRNDGWEVKLMLHDCAQWASGQLPRTGHKTF